MAELQITVYPDHVEPDPLQRTPGESNTITFVAGEGVSQFEIKNLQSGVFNPTESDGFVTSFPVSDNGTPGTYAYLVEAEATGSSDASDASDASDGQPRRRTWDPRIENGTIVNPGG